MKTSKVRPVLVLPMGGSKTNGVQVDEIYLVSGLRAFTVRGLGKHADDTMPRMFGTEHEAFDHAFMLTGWNVRTVGVYTDDDDS